MKKPARKPEKLMLRVVKGGFQPADNYTVERLRARGFHIGDLVAATLSKPRNPRFHRFAHVFGEILADNIDAFTGMGAHDVLKRLQIEGNIACDEMAIIFPGIGPCVYRVPRSLSFASMDETEFREVFRQFGRYIVATYWKGMEPEQIEEMAEMMIND